MKYLSIILFLFISGVSSGQAVDSSRVPYLMDKKIPFFKMIMTDSSLFYTKDLKNKKSTIIVYFSPDCEHCKKFTELLKERITEFKKTQFVMISPLPMNRIKEFYEAEHIAEYPTITMGKDALYFFGSYFGAHYIPFIAAYDKKGVLIKGWEGGVAINDLLEAVK